MIAQHYIILPAGPNVSIHTAEPVTPIRFDSAPEAERWIKDMDIARVQIIAVERRPLNYLEYADLNNAAVNKCPDCGKPMRYVNKTDGRRGYWTCESPA